MNISHLPNDIAQQLTELIKEFWCVFNEQGLFVPVKDYKCSIDTGSHCPIAAKKINYGPRESPIMERCIKQLLSLNQIEEIHDGQWLSKALLAPKPHQERITDIDKFVWQFFVNYIALNSVTKVIAHPIPRCDSAVGLAFRKSNIR